MYKKNISRREFLRTLGAGSLVAASAAVGLSSCNNNTVEGDAQSAVVGPVPTDEMTYRINKRSGDAVSILGFGCMRLPTVSNMSARENDDEIDQAKVNEQIDYALAHGVNYFDTSPAYCKGASEHAVGMALSRHDRSKYFIATKLSNFSPDTWSRRASLDIYYNSFKELQTNYIDYMLLHGIGIGGMEALNGRYIDNGILDFLLDERKAGRIRNLGFSYHGDIEVFDYLLSKHDVYQWDFVQIQLNYVDWHHAKEVNERNTDAEYLYEQLKQRDIPVVIMEPLLGGRLAKVNPSVSKHLRELRPNDSMAKWAFRFAGTPDGVLTVLSGMTYMEHLQENIRTYSPLEPCSDEELEALEITAKMLLRYPNISCTGCQYCMPCPYGINIPAIFAYYNRCVNDGAVPESLGDPEYKRLRRQFLVGYDRSVQAVRQADHCIGCGLCAKVCPQGINIPAEMKRINDFVEDLKQNKDF